MHSRDIDRRTICQGHRIGQASINTSLQLYKKMHKIKVFELRVYSWNNSAIRAYTKAGFRIIKRGQKVEPHPDGTIMTLKI